MEELRDLIQTLYNCYQDHAQLVEETIGTETALKKENSQNANQGVLDVASLAIV